jgi:hypothetical protein
VLCNCRGKGYPHDPKECTLEQIRKCHGDLAVHPCEEDADGEKDAIKTKKNSDK